MLITKPHIIYCQLIVLVNHVVNKMFIKKDGKTFF